MKSLFSQGKCRVTTLVINSNHGTITHSMEKMEKILKMETLEIKVDSSTAIATAVPL